VNQRAGFVVAALIALIASATPAFARVHGVTAGNYYFQDDATGSRTRLVVDQGDQIQVTVRAAAYPPHSVVIDEYGIDSGYIYPFQTYTSPPLNKPGTFILYCRAHRDRGHWTTLIVRAATASTPRSSPTASSGSRAQSPGAPGAATSPATPKLGAKDAPQSPAGASTESPVPAGIGEATDRRSAPPDPHSLAGVLGRGFGGGLPWTAALWLAGLAAVPIFGAAGLALRVERRRNPA